MECLQQKSQSQNWGERLYTKKSEQFRIKEVIFDRFVNVILRLEKSDCRLMLMGRNQPVEVTRKKSLGQAKVTEMSQEEIISVADV